MHSRRGRQLLTLARNPFEATCVQYPSGARAHQQHFRALLDDDKCDHFGRIAGRGDDSRKRSGAVGVDREGPGPGKGKDEAGHVRRLARGNRSVPPKLGKPDGCNRAEVGNEIWGLRRCEVRETAGLYSVRSRDRVCATSLVIVRMCGQRDCPRDQRARRANPRLGFQPSRISPADASERKKRSRYSCLPSEGGPDAAEVEKCSPPRCIFTRRPIQDTPIIYPWHAVAGPMP